MARTASSLLVVALVVAGCGSTPHVTGRQGPASSQTATVSISGYAFHPAQLALGTSRRITFVNRDRTAHTATATGQTPAFDTGTLKPGQSKTVTLTRPGTFTYYCQFHAFMQATIVIR